MKFHPLGLLSFFLVFLAVGSLVDAQLIPRKAVHKISVTDFFVSPTDLQCKETVTALVTVSNSGSVDETVFVEVTNHGLAISAFSPSIKIASGRKQTLLIPFRVEETTIGSYEFEIRLYSEQGIKRLFQTERFLGCPKPTITSLIPEQSDPFQPAQQKASSSPPFIPAPLLLTIVLLGVLGLLSVLFIFQVSYKR